MERFYLQLSLFYKFLWDLYAFASHKGIVKQGKKHQRFETFLDKVVPSLSILNLFTFLKHDTALKAVPKILR